jgi:O-antigen ligase
VPVLFEWLQAWPANRVVDEPYALGRVPIRVLWAVPIFCSVLASYVIVSEQYAWGAVIGIALVFALLCLVKPQLALLVFLIYLPIEGALKKVGIDLNVMRGVNPETFSTLLYAVICVPRVLMSAKPSRLSGRLILPMLLLSALMLVSIAWNPHLGTDRFIDDLAEIKRSTFFFLIFFLVMVTPDKRRYLNLYLGVFLLVCIYLSFDLAWVSMEKATLTNLGTRISRSTEGLHFNVSSIHTSPLVLGLGASFLTAIFVETKSTFWPRILLLAGAGILVLSSFLLLSRALSGAVAMGVFVTLLASGVSRRNAWALLVVPLCLWLFLPVDLAVRLGRASVNAQSGTGSLTTGRIEVAWPAAIETISEHPILGVGYGAYTGMNELAAHNQLLDIWVQVGIGGVILFLWMFMSLVKVAWRARHDGDPRTRAIANGLFGQLMGCVIALLFSDSFFSPWLTYSLFFVAVLLDPGGRATLEQKSVSGWRKRSLSAVGIG